MCTWISYKEVQDEIVTSGMLTRKSELHEPFKQKGTGHDVKIGKRDCHGTGVHR